jgi:hypothetical protein
MADFLSITYGRKLTFLALSLLYDDNNWGTMQFSQDHIFPQSQFSKKNMATARLDPQKQAQYPELRDRIGNLELLSLKENEEKAKKPFEQWLRTRDASFRKRHLIPADDRLLSFNRFEDFIEAREKLITERLQKLFSPD